MSKPRSDKKPVGKKVEPQRTCGNCDHFAQSPSNKRTGMSWGRCDGPGGCDIEAHESERCYWMLGARIVPEWTPVGGRKRRAKV